MVCNVLTTYRDTRRESNKLNVCGGMLHPSLNPQNMTPIRWKKCINRKTSLLSRQPQRSMSNDMAPSQSIKLMNRVLFLFHYELVELLYEASPHSYFQCYSEFPGQCTCLGGRFSGVPNVSSYLSSLFWWSQVTTLQTQNYHHAKVLLCW